MRLRTLGGLSLAGSSLRRLKPLLLLTYLALEGPKGRRYLAELFWPTAAKPRQSLNVALSQLRKAAPKVLKEEGALLEAHVECDAASLISAVAHRDWQVVADLYAGSFLAGVDVEPGSVELEEWFYLTREALAVRAQQAFIELAEEAAQRGDRRTSTRFTDRAAALHPEVSGADTRLLPRLHALLVHNDDPRAHPLRSEAAEVGIELPAAQEQKDAGATKRLTVNNLPRVHLPFVGRNRELDELEELLATGTRLLTIQGLGGHGKTRLAAQLARRLLENGRHDDIYFVSVEGAADPQQVLERLCTVVQVEPGRGSLQDALRERFAERAALLVLDNVEHLTSAATELEELLEACPGLALLCTSREPLGLYAETVYPLGGMHLPAPEEDSLGGDSLAEGLELFALTARRSDSRFRLDEENLPPILHICRRVAGAPLGIELAASLLRVMPPEELAQALESDLDTLVATQAHHPPRHADLRTVFEHSWRQLSPQQQKALAGASVFVGGFTRSAAARVLGMDLVLLGGLIDRSLITRQKSRYDLHPLVRQYVTEKLAEASTEAELRSAHADHYAQLLAEKGAFHRRAGQREAFQELDLEYGNIRAAWLWAVSAGRHELIGRMVTALPDYLTVRARTGELITLVNAALGSVPSGSEIAGRLLLAKGKALMDTETDEASAALGEVLKIAQSIGAGDLTALAHNAMGRVLLSAGDGPGARESWERALPALEQLDGGMYYGGCINNLGLVTGDRSTHENLLLTGLEATRRTGNVLDHVNILTNLACHQRVDDGDFTGALASMLEGIALERAEIDRRHALMVLHKWAAYYQVQLGALTAAREHLAAYEMLLAQRQPWEEEVPAEVATAWIRAQLHLASGGVNEAVACATLAGYDGPSLTLLAWHAVLRRDAAEAARLRDILHHGAEGPYPRTSMALRGIVHLLTGALALLTADSAGSSKHDPRTTATTELLHALRLATEYEFAPTALWAFAALPLLAPDHAAPELLALATSHPAALVTTRWFGGRLQGSLGDGEALAATPSPAARAEAPTRTELLARAARLADQLQGSSQFVSLD